MKTRALAILLAGILNMSVYSEVFTLQQAIDQHKVKAKAWSLGGHSGYCIGMELKNISGKTLCIEIEAGRRLNSINDAEQDILIVKQQTVELKSGESKITKVKGYCCQANNQSPNEKSEYGLNKMADMDLYLVARYLNANAFDPDVEQKAIWAVSEGRSAATITNKEDSLVKPLREMVATIKNEKMPWYTLITRTQVSSHGIISVYPIELKGELWYSNEKECYVTLQVLNDKGILVYLVRSEWLKAGSNLKYNLHLPVKQLAKGKYKVEMATSEKQLVTEVFEI